MPALPRLPPTIRSMPRKPAPSATPMRQSSLSPSSIAPISAVSTGEMNESAMASASGRRPKPKKKVDDSDMNDLDSLLESQP